MLDRFSAAVTTFGHRHRCRLVDQTPSNSQSARGIDAHMTGAETRHIFPLAGACRRVRSAVADRSHVAAVDPPNTVQPWVYRHRSTIPNESRSSRGEKPRPEESHRAQSDPPMTEVLITLLSHGPGWWRAYRCIVVLRLLVTPRRA